MAKKKSKKVEVKKMSVAEVCREEGVDPRKGRQRLRREGWSAKGKTYPPIEVPSKMYDEVLEIIHG